MGIAWTTDIPVEQAALEIMPREFAKTQEWIAKGDDYDLFLSVVGTGRDLFVGSHLFGSNLPNRLEAPENLVEVIKRYYNSEWYFDTDDARSMKKSIKNKDFTWYKMFSESLWLVLMIQDSEVLRILADWIEAWFEPEWLPQPVDPLWAKTYLSIAASFRTKPLKGQEEMEESIRKSRKKAPKLLFAAWEAARENDQASFEKALRESTQQFIKTVPQEVYSFRQVAAFGQSTVLAAARRLGMQLPDFDSSLMAYIPTSESIGLVPTKKKK